MVENDKNNPQVPQGEEADKGGRKTKKKSADIIAYDGKSFGEMKLEEIRSLWREYKRQHRNENVAVVIYRDKQDDMPIVLSKEDPDDWNAIPEDFHKYTYKVSSRLSREPSGKWNVFFEAYINNDNVEIDRPNKAWMLVQISYADKEKTLKSIGNIEGVVEVYPLFGEYDAILKIIVDNFGKIGVVENKIKSVSGVEKVKTMICLTW